MQNFDFIVIGAGIAGASMAAELAKQASVLLLEGESQPGYHTTGRSAALFTCAYGPAPIRALSRASEAFLREPDSPFIDHALLQNRHVIFAARQDQKEAYASLRKELGSAVTSIDGVKARSLVPLFREGQIEEALLDTTACDVDVAALHQHYLKSVRHSGGHMLTNAGVESLNRHGSSWEVTTKQGKFSAAAIVNAAGAWGDEIARLAGVAPTSLMPKRRTVLVVPAPESISPDGWPMVVDVDEKFFLKPEAGKFLISPADETLSPPCDAQPEDLDVAICIDRIETAFEFNVRRVEHKWAGLRSFVSDKCPVVGFDPEIENFFWLIGQGGYGIQTAPALSKVAACIALNQEIPQYIRDHGVEVDCLSRGRSSLGTTRQG